MKIIIPMAGMGKRMRPHTLTVPKPLLPVGGKSIVQRLVEDIVEVAGAKVTDIGFIVGDFGEEVNQQLVEIAEKMGAKGHTFQQKEPLGTAHAILCAREIMEGPVIVAFADTLFRADFKLDTQIDGIIWVHKVEDPKAFGVVKLNDKGHITDFIEKPETFVSDLAIIGIYYFKDGAYLRDELQYLIDHNIKDKGEFQITSALENMKNKGAEFIPGEVEEWMDCGNKDATVHTNSRVLFHDHKAGKPLMAKSVKTANSQIIEPCFLGENVEIKNAVVGPFVSVSANTKIENSVISNSIIQGSSVISGKVIDNSMIGNHVTLKSSPADLSIGDYTVKK